MIVRVFITWGVGLKLITVDRAFAEKHYADLSAKPFFNGLCEYIVSGPVVAMVWEGKGVVVTGRKIIGATNPLDSAPGTIRGDFAIDIGRCTYTASLLNVQSKFYVPDKNHYDNAILGVQECHPWK